MSDYGELVSAFQSLRLPGGVPVIAHASLSAFGQVTGGAETLLGALRDTCQTLLMPAFTYKTMVVPETGPADNAMAYGQEAANNYRALFYHPSLPVDRLIGTVAEHLRCHPEAQRSLHPILSFCGVNAGDFLQTQTLQEPLAPIRRLIQAGGWVLLLGVDQTVNTSLHYAEWLVGGQQFLRWALTPQKILACPGFPGCSDGFNALVPDVAAFTHLVQVGPALVQAIPLGELIAAAVKRLRDDPLALLCSRPYCGRCRTIEEIQARG